MDSEDRTQAPSKRRLQLAREQGQVAHSPELTAAAGLLGAAVALTWWGEPLASALLGLMRRSLNEPPVLSVDAAGVVAHLRGQVAAVAGPLGAIVTAFALTATAVHQGQVRGLWAPSLLAPDLARLWTVGQGPGVGLRAGRGLWGLARALVVATVAILVVRAGWPGLQRLAALETPALARVSTDLARHLLLTLAGATLVLGALDFALQHRRYEAMLRLTPEQHREDMRSAEGDPALRARRRRAAQAMRGGDAALLKGCTLVLTGPAGLTVVLAGGPPPRHVSIRAIQSGPQGEALLKQAEAARIPIVSAPDLARRFARRRPQNLAPTPDLLADLDPLWTAPTPQPA